MKTVELLLYLVVIALALKGAWHVFDSFVDWLDRSAAEQENWYPDRDKRWPQIQREDEHED